MYLLRCLKLIWIVPGAWIGSILIRKKPMDERYAYLARWAKRLMDAFKIQIQIHQEEELPSEGPILFVGNHQSEFDMLIQMCAIKRPFTFISKVENEKTPFVGSWSKTLDVLFFDRNDRSSGIHMLREASRRLKDHKDLLIYPEGTRSKGNQMHEMQAGSLQPAFMSKAYIVPVVLENSYQYIDIAKHKGTFHIHILRPIPFEEYKPLKAEGLISKLQKEMQDVLNRSTPSK
ncbi:MAG: lysophospholipid acyltransferase family protein [Longicatena sp.]